MADKTGVARLRQAIENQASVGEASFSMPFDEASALLRECEDELWALSWAKGVPVPVDADGNVVPLDTEKLYTDDGEMVRVDSICYGSRLWYVRRMRSDKTYSYWLDSLHLRRPDSWERLEEDVNLGCRDYCERYRLDECEYNVRVHLLERAKALAKRGAKEAGRG